MTTRPRSLAMACVCFLAALPLQSLLSPMAVAGPELIKPRSADGDGSLEVSGELKQWHKVTLTLDGPFANESDTKPNPFFDYRFNVEFSQGDKKFLVPGYFCADGNAANSSAKAGTKWRVHFCPVATGTWDYKVSFRRGNDVAVSDDADAGTAVKGIDGKTGRLEIGVSDKTGRDHRGKGRLQYVGKHHLQFAGNKEFFLKCGADAPENFLAYADFDGDFKSDGKKDNLVKTWQPHVRDWKQGDPTWQDGKGKGMIGAINYLADQGMNAFSFLTMNINGDDRNVFPYVNYDDVEHLDCSRLDQWEVVFEHADKLGMYLHFKTQECENVNVLDDRKMGRTRALYYRELIARFAHHLALNWNLGEEVGYQIEVDTQDKKDWAEYFWTHDPYQNHIVIHNGNRHYELMGPADKGGSHLTGFSLQTSKEDFRNVHGSTLNYLNRSVKAGKPWVVACDEPGDATHSLIPDDEDPTRDNPRQNALWGNLMAGGAGVEWYFGYKHPHSDLTCQDYRSRHKMWNQSRYALEFFKNNDVPFWRMKNDNKRLSDAKGYCLRATDETVFVAFLKSSESAKLDLAGAKGVFNVKWYNPRSGGQLQSGSVSTVDGGSVQSLGQPPEQSDRDWVVLLVSPEA